MQSRTRFKQLCLHLMFCRRKNLAPVSHMSKRYGSKRLPISRAQPPQPGRLTTSSSRRRRRWWHGCLGHRLRWHRLRSNLPPSTRRPRRWIRDPVRRGVSRCRCPSCSHGCITRARRCRCPSWCLRRCSLLDALMVPHQPQP